MSKMRTPCPHCAELIQADAKKCHYCGEWLTKTSATTHFSRVWQMIKILLLWVGVLYLWFLYAYNNIDRSEAAYRSTLNTGPVVSGYALPLLAVILAFLLRKQVFSRAKSIGSILAKVMVILVLTFGLYNQFSYDPTLAKLHAYKNAKDSYTGSELLEAMNDHRMSIGVQELQLDQRLCSNLVERWLDIKNPNNGHKGLKEWGEANNLIKDDKAVAPFDNLNELYVTTTNANRAIELWIGSPGHKVVLENPDYNVACTYAADGTGVAIIGFKE
jgi:hypothetical protein